MMNFREICKTIFFSIVSVNLGVSSGLEILGIVFAALFIAMHAAQFVRSKKSPELQRIPRYKKLFAYGAIVPCALWWVLTPSVENGVSPYLVFIPAWYLLYLAWLQKRSLGNGDYEAFVVFNGVAVLFMGLFQAPRGCVISAAVALILAVYAFGRPRVALYKRLLFVLMYAMLCGSSYLGFKYWKSHHYYSGRWAEDYYLKNRVMGFDPVAALGSFSSNYNSKYNDEIVLRIWDTLAPQYLRAAAYEKYVAGIWKLPAVAEKKLYPARYRVDYAVFETSDSAAAAPNVKNVWVQATLDNFGFMFTAPNAVGVAVKNADSLNYYSTNIFSGTNGIRSDWYYYVPDSAKTLAITATEADEADSSFLQISEKNRDLLDSVVMVMALPVRDFTADTANADSALTPSQFAVQNLKTIEQYFIRNFKYSYIVPGKNETGNVTSRNSTKDPLQSFWTSKSGYCEYYATLATLLLRYQGIPARYVTGFAHPERIGNLPYVTFRRRHSHAWVEVYIDHKWYIFDPTPPILANDFAAPSWISQKIEGLKGRLSYVFHLLKDGEWRRVVDSWQNSSERLIASPIFYVFVLVLIAVFMGLKFRKYRYKKSNDVVSEYAVQWISILENAEKRLARMGFVRAPGETVSAFAIRVRLVENYKKTPSKENSNESAKIERREREIALAVKHLEDYESNRWRIN